MLDKTINFVGYGFAREQVSWSKPEGQRTEPGKRPKTQLKKERSLNNKKKIDN